MHSTEDTEDLARRYVAMWNEPDPARRRTMIGELWAEDGEHLLEPPADMRAQAEALGMAAPKLEIRGHAALERRVARAYADFVADGKHAFRLRPGTSRLRNVVKLGWEMFATATNEPLGGGLDVLTIDADGRIACDHQFIDP
jgi:hypothetical protein